MARMNEIDMTHGPLAGKMLRFALPLAASSVLQQLFNAADLAVVGRFANADAMAAVGSNAPVINLLVSLFVGLSVGANVVIANLVGSGRRERIRDAVHTSIALALASGVFLLVAGIVLSPFILRLMGAPQNVMSLAVIYLRIYFLGMPAMMVYNFGSAVLRSRGDSKRPFFCLTLAGIINIALNLLFVIVFQLHVIGVALATVLSNCVSAGLVLRFLATETGEFRLDFRRLRFHSEFLRSILRVGLPAGLQGMVFALSNVVIQSGVNSFGANCIAGMTAAQNFEYVSWCTINAFAQTVVTFTGQNYGAGDEQRCRKVLRLGLTICIGVDLIILAAILLSRHVIIQLFTTDPAVIAFSMVRFERVVALHFLCATYEVPGGAMRGMNRSMVPALISVLGTCAFRLLYIFTLFPLNRTIENLMLVYPASWVLTGIVMNAAYFIVRKKAFAK